MHFKKLTLIGKVIYGFLLFGFVFQMLIMGVGGGLILAGGIEVALDKNQIFGLVVMMFIPYLATRYSTVMEVITDKFQKKHKRGEYDKPSNLCVYPNCMKVTEYKAEGSAATDPWMPVDGGAEVVPS